MPSRKCRAVLLRCRRWVNQQGWWRCAGIRAMVHASPAAYIANRIRCCLMLPASDALTHVARSLRLIQIIDSSGICWLWYHPIQTPHEVRTSIRHAASYSKVCMVGWCTARVPHSAQDRHVDQSMGQARVAKLWVLSEIQWSEAW